MLTKSNLGFEMKQISDFAPADIVKTCPRIESGLRLGPEAVRACCFSAIISPEYWRSEDVPNEITKTDLIKKRQDLFLRLNDDVSDVSCKKCLKVESKRFEDVGFDKLGFIDLAHYSSCNLRCDYCGFTQRNDFHKQKYDALKLLNLFSSNDVQFESSVDFNGGEPTILKDLSLYLEYFRKNKIRVRMYTNGVRYSEEIFEAIKDGTISWLIISVDAGTESTFLFTKKKNSYKEVIANIAKYSKVEGYKGAGKVAAKYIFTDNNLSKRDVDGFVEDMSTAKPQQIWLLYDFIPLIDRALTVDMDVVSKYTSHIEAYSNMYMLFLSRGIEPMHFYDTFLSSVIDDSICLMDETKRVINAKIEATPNLRLLKLNSDKYEKMSYEDIVMLISSSNNLAKILIAPAGILAAELLADDVDLSNVVGLADLSIAKHGKQISGKNIYNYDYLSGIEFNVLIVLNPYHFDSILSDVVRSRGVDGLRIICIDNARHQSY